MNKDSLVAFKDATKQNLKRLLTWVKENKLKSLMLIGGASFLLLVIFIASIYFGAFGKLPTVEELKKIRNPQATTIYTGNNKVLGYFYVENRSNIDSTQINDHVKNALIATEDNRFYEHNGIDYRSLARVLVKTILLQKKSSGGGSTITQQLAKNVFGRKRQFLLSTPINKIREMFIARRLEKVYSKDDIILLYLNTVPFGDKVYGIEKAARRFFNKKPEELNLEEASTIVGILKATTYYNPQKNPENSLARRNVVLAQMLKYEYLDSVNYQNAISKELVLDYTLPKKESSFAAHYKDFLRKEFNQWAIANPKADGSLWSIDEDGLSIYTTLHSSIQNSAEKGVKSQLDRLQKNFEEQWDAVGGKNKFIKNLIENHPLGKRLSNQGMAYDSIKTVFLNKTSRTIWNGNEVNTGQYAILDSILYEYITLQAGLIAMHSETGKIMAYVGGKDYGFSQYDQVNLPKQVGSTFKPIVYLSALENGVKPCDYFDNEQRVYANYKDWSPKNANGKYGGSYATYGALANSINTVSVQMMFKAGIKNVINLAHSMGIEEDLPAVPSLVLGTAEIPLREMVVAYGSIANGGKVVEPYSLLKIVDEDGNVLYQAKPNVKGSVRANLTSIRTLQKMMSYTNTIGTGQRIQNYNIPYNIIGKTGTTQNNADGWYIAATPEIVCGAWVGTMDNRINFKSTRWGSGANTALPMVGRVFGDLSRWNTQIISNFETDSIQFQCPPFSPMNAEATMDSLANPDSAIRNVSGFLRNLFRNIR